MREKARVAEDTFYLLSESDELCLDSEHVARFWSYVERGPNCWLWRGTVNKGSGYGQFGVAGRTLGAHRVAWALTHGPIPDGQHVLHACDTPLCCNPGPVHLFLGTHRTNMEDAARKGRLHVTRPKKQTVSAAVVSQIKALRASGVKLDVIARQFGVTKSYVSLVTRGKRRQYDAEPAA